MIAGGGTGGHIFPGLAIAEALERSRPDTEVFFAGRRGSIEERVVSRTGRPFLAVPSMGLRRKADVRNLAMPFVVAGGYAKALAVLSRRKPDAAVGTGGFISVPPIAAAVTLRVPVLLQEQNSYPGLATRILSRWAGAVHVTFEETREHLPNARAIEVSGNPVRSGLALTDRAEARESFGLSPEAPVILAFGGSKGAVRINEAIKAALPRLRELGAEFILQTGSGGAADMESAADAAGVRAVVKAFFDDMGQAYAACDLVVSRAGATTIAELTLLGKASILVPYPYATEDHQMKNARAMERAGAAVVIPDGELTGERLAGLIEGLLSNRHQLAAAADAAGTLARPDAADRVAQAVLVLAGAAGQAAGHATGGGATEGGAAGGPHGTGTAGGAGESTREGRSS
jgi:UDP-N-acetylglucosamine--N-acetylmuramyl-(pentapeptide) pyrophosphoryl-undecaprenol N-acetylglucosamine transferase